MEAAVILGWIGAICPHAYDCKTRKAIEARVAIRALVKHDCKGLFRMVSCCTILLRNDRVAIKVVMVKAIRTVDEHPGCEHVVSIA